MPETTKTFNTRIGDLTFDHDYPTNPTVQHLYNTMDQVESAVEAVAYHA